VDRSLRGSHVLLIVLVVAALLIAGIGLWWISVHPMYGRGEFQTTTRTSP
jgi:hypothetical protein